MFSLQGQAVLVTGASSGLGRHFAKTIANAGASHLVLASRRLPKLQAVAEDIETAVRVSS